MGNARVAPLKVMTIPRLELATAVLAAKVDRMFKVQGFFICHIINYTGYNQK